MKTVDNIRLKLSSSIKEALEIIDSGAMKIAVVLDDENKLIGTVSDGDIRRGLLKGIGLEDTVESVIHKAPIVCGVNDSKADILKKAIEKKIYQIPIVDVNGVLVGVDDVDELLKPTEHPNQVVIMVGGLGSRLGSLTNDCPKPLLEVGNKPILETIIENFAKYGFKKIILSVNYKSQMIEDYFGDGSAFGVNIEYVNETQRMGTAGALSLLREKLSGAFFVMNGDLLTNVNFEHMLDYHQNHDACATMGVREYDIQVPFGVLSLDGHKITGIKEKPVHKFFVNGGVYILDESVLEFIPNDDFYDMPTLFEKIVQSNMNAVSFPIREYWLDIGRISDYELANAEYHGVFK